jgi:hypothetical protein
MVEPSERDDFSNHRPAVWRSPRAGTSRGPVGGPFNGTRIDVKLGNRSPHAALDWSVRSPTWVTLTPDTGTIDARKRVTIQGNLDSAAAAGMAAGRYVDTIVFHNETTVEEDIVVPVTLIIDAQTVSGTVTPATDFYSQGAAGGPFQPDSVVYQLTNTGSVDFPWQADTADSWVAASPSSGNLAAGASVNVTVAIQDGGTSSMSNGVHPSSVTFRENTGGTTIATRQVSLNVQAGQQSSGWTTFTPSADTRIVYVSSTQGNDANDGLSQQTPKRTLGAARALLRDGYPDWMLLRCGDGWDENFGGGIGLSGRSNTERMLLSSYGSGPRPQIRSGSGNGFNIWGNGDGNNMALVGLHFWPNTYNGGNGTPRCIGVYGEVSNLLIEDCYLQAAEVNLVIQGASTLPGPTGRHKNIELRRNVVVDAYATSTDNTAGLYAQGTDGLLLEENIFDHNGWRDDVPGSDPTWYRRNCYIQDGNTGVVVRGNIIAQTDGIQVRCGGTVEGNLVMKNAIGILFGGGQHPDPNGVVGTVRENVVLDGNDLQAGSPRGWGMNFENVGQAVVERNVVAHNVNGHAPYPVTFGIASNGAGVHNLDFQNNVVFDWNGVTRFTGNASQTVNVHLTNNKFQNEVSTDPLIVHNQQESTAGVYSSGNAFNSIAQLGSWMQAGNILSLNQWKPMVHDTTSIARGHAVPGSEPDDRDVQPIDRRSGFDRSLHGRRSAPVEVELAHAVHGPGRERLHPRGLRPLKAVSRGGRPVPVQVPEGDQVAGRVASFPPSFPEVELRSELPSPPTIRAAFRSRPRTRASPRVPRPIRAASRSPASSAGDRGPSGRPRAPAPPSRPR